MGVDKRQNATRPKNVLALAARCPVLFFLGKLGMASLATRAECGLIAILLPQRRRAGRGDRGGLRRLGLAGGLGFYSRRRLGGGLGYGCRRGDRNRESDLIATTGIEPVIPMQARASMFGHRHAG